MRARTSYLFELNTFSVVHDGEVLLVVVQVIQREGPIRDRGRAGLRAGQAAHWLRTQAAAGFW